MDPSEYVKLLEYVNENNSWDKMYTCIHDNHRRVVKYVNCSFDTRDGKIWRVGFHGCVSLCDKDHEKVFNIDSPEDVSKIYEWLDKVC